MAEQRTPDSPSAYTARELDATAETALVALEQAGGRAKELVSE